MKKICFSVINDLTYDQRMRRICESLSADGFSVTLIGRRLPSSVPLQRSKYRQRRLPCFFKSGKLMYAEYNLRLLFHLLFISTDCYVAIDLDTIIPNFIASKLRRKHRVYDAHELFTELKEVITRPFIHRIWKLVESFAVPRFFLGYTVNDFIAAYFKERYHVNYLTIRNLPVLTTTTSERGNSDQFFIYQGAVNEGRSFETLIPAMKEIPATLLIYGDGNFIKQVSQIIDNQNLRKKVFLMGPLPPDQLREITERAYAGLMLFENKGLNQYQSLSNRFFDYIMAGIPQVCVNFPQYKAINDKYDIAVLINDTKPETIASALNNLLNNPVMYARLAANCVIARKELNWQKEEKILIAFYHNIFET